MELECYKYNKICQPGKNNIPADIFSRAHSGTTNIKEKLADLHTRLCNPRITRQVHFIRIRNLPYSVEEVKKVCAVCPTCVQLKSRFYTSRTSHLTKAMQLIE